MASDQYEMIINFCKKYPSVACYGASEHGFIVKHFLEMHNIRVTAFIVSDDVSNGSYRDGVPVYSVQNIKSKPVDFGIVLSLYERHHNQVIAILNKYGYKDNVFPISDSMQNQMHEELLVAERKKTLYSKIDLTKLEYQDIEKKANSFFISYQYVECHFFDILAIGAYGLWIYYWFLRNQTPSNIFHLYYPVVYEHRKEEKLKGANGYLTSKLNASGIAVVSETNINFWKYIFQNHPSQCKLYNDYSFTGWSENLSKVCNCMPLNENLIYLNNEEMIRGNIHLNEMNVSGEYVCISNRDIVYRKIRNREKLKSDFRDKYRNSNISNHALAVTYLESRRIQAVRVGAAIEREWNHKNVISYAGSKWRSEFMDVYLVHQCKFFISDLSGILAFAMLMAKPMIVTNAALLTTRYDAVLFISPKRDIALLKKLWDEKNNKYLTIRDMLDFEVNICRQEKNIAGAVYGEYHRRGIVPINNSPEEILAAVQEMNERIDGTIQYDDLDIELQSRYRNIVDNYPMRDNVLNNWRIGAKFLRDNQWLLE